MKKQNEIFVDYQNNLQNTEDAYSDSEIANYSKSKLKNTPSTSEASNDYKEVYKSCHFFLFEATGIVKDKDGTTVET